MTFMLATDIFLIKTGSQKSMKNPQRAERNCQTWTVYLTGLSFKNEG